MRCSHPYLAFYNKETKSYEMVSFKSTLYNTILSDLKTIIKGNNNIRFIPCGKCVACRINKANEWKNRLLCESKERKYKYFITLTYDEENVPNFLEKSHLKKFLKDLKNYFYYHFDKEIPKYFACGEYGEKSFRPHFHLILFTNNKLDLVYHSHIKGLDYNYYNCDIISKFWKYGFHIITEATTETFTYVCGYTLKKQIKGVQDYQVLNIQPPFILVSKNMGKNYYLDNFDKVIDNSLTIGSSIIAPTPYFKKYVMTDEQKDLLPVNTDNYINFLNENNINNIFDYERLVADYNKSKIKKRRLN